MEMITLNLKSFKKKGVLFPSVFKMKDSLDYQKLYNLEHTYFVNDVSVEEAFRRLKTRTSKEYYNNILTAQTDAINYAINVFPPYKLLLPDVLMDDWLSIIGPHQKNRRDHSLHQPLTAYIVSELLKGGPKGTGLVLPSGKSLLDECSRIFIEEPGTKYLRDFYEEIYPNGFPSKGSPRNIWACSVFYETAIIAALFHDIGYPWQFLHKVGGNIKTIDQESVESNYCSPCGGLYEFIKKRLLAYPFYGYSNVPEVRPTMSWEKEIVQLIDNAYHKTHGFPGALAFMFLNDYVRKFMGTMNRRQADCRFIQEWASLGILMHDMPDQYLGKNKRPDQPRFKLYIDKDPLSCIIALADILEEFGRPKASYGDVYKKGIKVNYDYPCDETIVNLKGDTLEIKYKFQSIGDKIVNEKYRREEVEKYFNSYSGYMDLTKIGINSVTCTVL